MKKVKKGKEETLRREHTIKRTKPKHCPPARRGAQVPRPYPRVNTYGKR